MGEFYTIKEFAKKLGFHHNTIRKAIKNNRIKTIRLGKGRTARHRIPESEIFRMATFDLEEYLEKEIQRRMGERL